jgi:hypothetical protein
VPEPGRPGPSLKVGTDLRHVHTAQGRRDLINAGTLFSTQKLLVVEQKFNFCKKVEKVKICVFFINLNFGFF